MGYHDAQNSYIHFLLVKLTGLDVNAQTVETLTLVVFLVSLVLSVWLNIRDRKRRKDEVY